MYNNRRTHSLTSIGTLLLGSAAFAVPMSVSAQTALANAAASEPAAGAGGLEEIVVTARKREESLQDVPVAVTAISAEELDRQAITSIEKVAAATPQLIVIRGSNGSGASLNMRGIGSSFTSVGIEQSVAVNVDGVYYGQGRVLNEGFFDMKQVEILKGPQALFFGKNATAGVISFTSADPGDHFEALARGGYEFEAEQVYAEGVISAPLSDTFGLRLAVRGANMSGGYVKNEAPASTFSSFDIATGALTTHAVPAPERDNPGEEETVARLTAKWTPSDDFSVTLKGVVDRNRSNNPTGSTEMLECSRTGSAQVNPGETCKGDWTIQQNNLPADVAASNPLYNEHGGALYQDYDSYSGTGILAYSNEVLSLNSVTGYHHFKNLFLGDYDSTGASEGGTMAGERSEYQAWSTEQRLQTTLDSPLNFMLGLYNQGTKLDFNQDVIFPGNLENSAAADPTRRYVTVGKVSQTKGDTFAVFGQMIWKFLPDWELAPGARYTHETKRSFFTQPYVIAPYQGFFIQYDPSDPTTQLAANQTFNNVSPEATLTWKPTEDLTIYGAYKQGFKSGGFSGSALFSGNGLANPKVYNTNVGDVAFDPEKVAGFEGGIKTVLMDRRLRLNFAAYHYQYDDLQVDFFDSGKIQFITTNVGSAITQGLEMDAEWAPEAISGLTFDASAAYNDAHYKDFSGAPCFTGQTIAQGCSIDPASGRPVQDLSGENTMLSPEWVGSLRANYTRPIGQSLVAGLSLGARYSSDYALNSFGMPNAKQDAYVTWDGSVRLGSADETWEVAMIGKNLTNEYILTYAQAAPSTGGGQGTAGAFPSDLFGTPMLPRTVQLQFTYRYE